MKIERPIAFLDVETTGVDPVTSRIIELGVAVMETDGTLARKWSCRFNPQIAIPATATEIHGITDEDVKDSPIFADCARKIIAGLQDKDLAGYNLRRLDLPILDEELRRAGLRLSLRDVRIIDCYGIFSKKAPRNLEGAVRTYCGREHAGAHGALADAIATADVFNGQLAAHSDLADMNIDELANYSRIGEIEYADLSGKLYRDADGDICYAFGKCKDSKVRNEPGFGRWMLTKDFSGSTLDAIEIEFDRLEAERESQRAESAELQPQGVPF